jgi:hypothetical protein
MRHRPLDRSGVAEFDVGRSKAWPLPYTPEKCVNATVRRSGIQE